MKDGPDKIVGNIYRPNTVPLANLERSIEIHNHLFSILFQTDLSKYNQLTLSKYEMMGPGCQKGTGVEKGPGGGDLEVQTGQTWVNQDLMVLKQLFQMQKK